MVAFPEPTMIKTNGIDMAVYEMGPKDGIPVVMCHGFPELAYSWRHQLPALAAAGFRAIAPDQRGYGRTSQPEQDRGLRHHPSDGDLAGMLDALGLKKAIFVGHDWGGLVVWMMPLLHPERVAGVIGVNTPFLPRAPMDPIAAMRAVYGENMYIVYFQTPGVADAVLAKDVGKTFRFFMRKGGTTAEEFAKRPQEERNLELVHALQSDESGWPGELVMSPEELQSLRRHLHAHRLHRRHQLVPQFHAQLADHGALRAEGGCALPDDHGRGRRRALARHGGRHGALRAGSRKGPDPATAATGPSRSIRARSTPPWSTG